MLDITIKNYRCFPQSRPVRLHIRPGLTAFVGINNSGKSSLLRLFFELRNLFGYLSSPNGNLLSALHGERHGLNPHGVLDPREIFPRSNEADSEIVLSFAANVGDAPRPTSLMVSLHRTDVTWSAHLNIPGVPFERRQLHFQQPSPVLMDNRRPLVDLSPLFAAATELHQSCYLPAFRNAINTGTRDDYYDISVGQSFARTFRQWKTGNSIQQNEATHRLIEDIRELFDFDRLDINPSPDDTTLQLFINGRSFRLHELGSGLAQFILVFTNVAVKQPATILIDEPELSLHPSLQLRFLARLARYASRGVLFATHSYGLARSAADQIYAFGKVAEGETDVKLHEAADLPALLKDLSFSGYRDLGFEKILLVEGPHDLPVFRHFLRLLRKDHRVVALPLGGDGMINGGRIAELEEIKRITPGVCAIIDSERAGPEAPLAKNRSDFTRACQRVGVSCHVLERRAMENYFPEAAVQRIRGPKYRALGPFEKFADVPLEWSKGDNWLVATEMSQGDLLATDVGRFLDSL